MLDSVAEHCFPEWWMVSGKWVGHSRIWINLSWLQVIKNSFGRLYYPFILIHFFPQKKHNHIIILPLWIHARQGCVISVAMMITVLFKHVPMDFIWSKNLKEKKCNKSLVVQTKSQGSVTCVKLMRGIPNPCFIVVDSWSADSWLSTRVLHSPSYYVYHQCIMVYV